ncbi:hypothetical protein M3J09_003583 [Ascochyta lentis]
MFDCSFMRLQLVSSLPPASLQSIVAPKRTTLPFLSCHARPFSTHCACRDPNPDSRHSHACRNVALGQTVQLQRARAYRSCSPFHHQPFRLLPAFVIVLATPRANS